MQTSFVAALLAALISAENVLPDTLAENPHRELSNCPEIGEWANCLTEDCCIEANAGIDVNPWYEYKWNAEGCYCEHHWKKGRVVESCENNNKVANPHYQAYSNECKCIDNLNDFVCPTPSAAEICADTYGDTRFQASAYL